MSVCAYIRVSSPSQDYAYQRHAIEAAARGRRETIDAWYADVASGASSDRPELARLRCAVERGGVQRVWVWRLDRLTRGGIADTLGVVADIRNHGAELVSVADQVALEGGPAGDLVLSVLAWCAQMERTKIRENQDAARARMSRQGRAWGRPSLPAALKDSVIELRKRDMSCREIASELKISKTWVHRVLRECGLTAAAEKG